MKTKIEVVGNFNEKQKIECTCSAIDQGTYVANRNSCKTYYENVTEVDLNKKQLKIFIFYPLFLSQKSCGLTMFYL